MVERSDLNAEAGIYWQNDLRLAPLSTLEVGGPARFFARCSSENDLRTALAFARRRDEKIFILGGGSNVLIADRGWDGLVLQQDDATIELENADAGHMRLKIAAGAPWDLVVRWAVEAGLGGIECLSGIPGLAGAAPIQNIGAYGQEVAERVERVRVIERETGEIHELTAEECGFAYRFSHFKGEWRNRFLVTRLDLRLPKTNLGTVRYGELSRRLAEQSSFSPSPSTPYPTVAIRHAVLELRRSKSMVLEAAGEGGTDPNRRSAGSFFLNPVVSTSQADRVEQRATARGVPRALPRFSASRGVKLPAAWLIEEAGFGRGYGEGPAGLSSRHCLALINRGGAKAQDLVDLARRVRRGVDEAFGVLLEPEPVFVGFERSVEELLS